MELGLDSLTLNDTQPPELVRSAKAAGFDFVSLWVQPPPMFPNQLVTSTLFDATRAALDETGMRVGALEVFDMNSIEAIESYRPALEMGARLGATTAAAINVATADPAKVADVFARFAEVAREYGLSVTLEPLASFATATLAQARDILRRSGTDAGLVLDVLHLMREGGTVADVRAIEPGLLRAVQLCDGVASMPREQQPEEAAFERLLPGEGTFPLAELLSGLPRSITWSIEAPSRKRQASGMSPAEQARLAMAAVRQTLQKIEPPKT